MKRKLTPEAVYPYVIGCASGVLFVWKVALPVQWSAESLSQFFGAVLNVSAIGAGFLGTALSVLYSIENKPVVQDLIAAGAWGQMLRYTMAAIRWSFALAVLSAVGLFVVDKIRPDHYSAALGVWSFVVFIAALLCVRVIHLFSRILAAK